MHCGKPVTLNIEILFGESFCLKKHSFNCDDIPNRIPHTAKRHSKFDRLKN